jgi:hypothetical protein
MALGAMLLAPAALAAPVTHAPPAHAADYQLTENAHSGGYFAATNTTVSGGGIYQDIALNTTAGETVCGSAWLRTEVPDTGASGQFVMWLIGTAATDLGGTPYSQLSYGDSWTQVHTCVEATGSHTLLRVQLYPDPGSSTVEMDDVNVDVSLAANGGFETGQTSWAVYPGTSTGFAVYGNAPGAPGAYSGTHFAATNTSTSTGSIYQDIALNTSAGQLICGSARVRTEYPATGAHGAMNLFLIGGAATDASTTAYANLPDGNDWTEIQTCVEATGSHTTLRVQFYPDVGSPTVEIDDVNVDESLAANGGFETGQASWAPYPGTSSGFAVYGPAPGAPGAYSGGEFGATNTTTQGGGIYQDIALNTSAGQFVCASARVRTEYPTSGAHGAFNLFLFGGGATDSATTAYAHLPDGNNWTLIQTCVEATSSHPTLRVQFYPDPGSPTVEMDDVNVDESLAANGGFENGSGSWAPFPGTNSNYVVYANGQVKATIVTPPTPVQPTPQPTTIPLPKGRHALKIKVVIKWTWRYGTTRIGKIKVGHFPHSTHLSLTCKGRGCPHPLKLSAKGPKRIHALLKKLIGRRYHAGDVLIVAFTAKGWRRERARIAIRRARKPLVTRA